MVERTLSVCACVLLLQVKSILNGKEGGDAHLRSLPSLCARARVRARVCVCVCVCVCMCATIVIIIVAAAAPPQARWDISN